MRRWSLVGLALIVVATVFSDGFHQADEHFQILEFAGFKLGRTPAADLPWEFGARMRSWLQPALYVLLVRAAETAGIRDPFQQALGLRLFSGLIAWAALVATTRSVFRLVPGDEARQWCVRLTWLACFTPFFAVRTSSESLSTSCFLLGLAAMTGQGRPRLVLLCASGVLFGLAFQLRFAVGVMVASVWLWALLGRHLRPRELAAMALSLLPTLVLGATVDHWGYGEWTLPAWTYVRQNLGEGVAARFGTLPWYGYVSLGAHGVLAPIILLLQLGTVVAWVRWPRHVVTAATLPFVLVHCLIAHKELRFLFPIALLTPALLVLAAVDRRGAWWPVLEKPAARVALVTLLGIDLVALVALALLPLRPQIGFQRFAFRLAPERLEAVVLTSDTPWHHSGLPMHFYWPPSLELRRGIALAEAAAGRGRVLVVADAYASPAGSGLRCEALYRPYPAWTRSLALKHPALHLRGWSLHRCRPEQR